MLRSYLPKDHELKPLELGSEPTVQEFIGNMVRVFGLVRETMADHGTCWLNMGDTYANGNSGEMVRDSSGGVGGGKILDTLVQKHAHSNPGRQPGHAAMMRQSGIESGNLCLIPQRLAIALQDDGWIIRSVIVWHKPAPMPASVSGWMFRRCRVKVGNGNGRLTPKQHEAEALGIHGVGTGLHTPGWRDGETVSAQWSDCPGCEKCSANNGLVLRRGSWRPTSSWEPILMLAKSANYFADGEAVKTQSAPATVSRNQYSRILDDPDEQFAVKHDHETTAPGANPRDVQTWASEPLKLAHYAAYPTALVRFCLRAGTSLRGYCPTCGAPWARIVEPQTPPLEVRTKRNLPTDGAKHSGFRIDGVFYGSGQKMQNWLNEHPPQTLGWRPTCRCPEQEPRPGLVLDPFAGSGRTLLTAQRMGLDSVGCELNPEYIAMARKILRDDAPLFAGGVE